MNATCKRLLSWLVVVTMVLSMVPVFDLSNFAVTTKAAENPAKDTLTAIENLRADFAGKTGTVTAKCPVCGGEEAVEWTALSGATAQLANPNGHYYLSGDVTFTAAGTTYSTNNNTLCLNLNGNDITAGGIALNLSYGNIINVMDSAETDGVVTGTAADFQGGAINVGNVNAKFNIYGGTFKKTGATGSVVCVRTNGGEINMYGGTIDASDASSSACATTINVMSSASAAAAFNLYGGTVKCGTMTAGAYNARGNIMLGYGGASNATFSMYGGTVVGGSYTGAAGGGGGTFGMRWENTLNISGGTVYGGTSVATGANIFTLANEASNINISGGTIVGEIYAQNKVNVKLSGDPQIVTSLELESGETVTATRGFDVSAVASVDATELTGGEIQVSGVALNAVLPVTCTDAAATAAYFSHVDATLDVGANDANQLVVIEYVDEPDEPVVGVFDPANCGGMAFCPVCGEAAGAQEWTALSGATAQLANPNGHYYLSGDVTFTAAGTSYSTNNNTLCLNLNGNDITAGGIALNLSYGNIINVMDTAETDGVVTGKAGAFQGGAINVGNANAKLNIYGGTFKKTADSAGSVVCVRNNGGEVSMYGGIIDASDATNSACASTINVMSGANVTTKFNLYGGTVKCGTMTAGGVNYRANIMLGYSNYSGATFNMEGGTVVGGNYTGAAGAGGGTFGLVMGNTLNISGGTIYGGTSNAAGANIFSIYNGAGNLNISGGTIVGEVYARNAINVKLSGDPQIVTSLELENGETVTATNGFDVSETTMDISELTADAQIEVTGAKGRVFTAAHENAANVVESFDCTTDGLTVAVNADNQLYIAEEVDPTVPVEGVFNPEGCNGYAYCPVCEGKPVLWTKIDSTFVTGTLISANNAGNHDHVYLAENISREIASGFFLGTGNNNRICLNLNGKELTVTGGGRVFQQNNDFAYWKVMDTEDAAVVTGNGVFHMNGNGARTVDVYGGTFKTNGSTSIVNITSNGGTFTLHDGKLDATGAAGQVFSMQGKAASGATATFNVYGGEIIGNGEIVGRVGSVLQANATTSFMGCATFNMTAGTISGGYVQVRNDNTATISGGSIEYLTTYDGAYEDDSTGYADADYSGVTTVTLTGTPEIAQLHINEKVVVNIDGLTAGAEIAIDGKTGVTLIETTNATAQGCIEAYREYLYVAIDGNALSLAQMQAAVVTAEGETFYPTVAEAITKVGTGYVALYADDLTVTISGDTYIDNRGYTVTVKGEGKLYAMDAANDDYVGYGGWTVNGPEFATDVINPVNGNRYIVIQNTDEEGNLTGTSSAHRVEMYLTFVSLRTAQAGLYYKAAYKCDNALADRVNGFGIVFNATVDGETVVVSQETFDPAANIYSIDGNAFTPNEEHVVNGTSTQVFNIFNTTRSNTENVAYGEAKIGATPYINVDTDGDGMSDADPYVIANLDNEVYKANAGVTYAAWSLFDVLKAINDDWASYESAQGQVQKFYNDWANYGMSDWAADLANIAG